MNRSLLLSLALPALVLAPAAIARAERCNDTQLNRILAPAAPGDTTALVDCDLELSPLLAAAITRRLIFVGAASSGATVDCHGGVIDGRRADELEGRSAPTLLVTSRRIGSSSIPGVGIWEPVSDVTIRDCEVIGSIRIRGMGWNGNDDEPRFSSHVPLGHVARVRAAAPRRITLERITLVGVHTVPLYVAIGTQDTTISSSYITGRSIAVAIYLDAETTRTTIRDSTIDTDTRRELIAIDGSTENRIVGNWFSHLEDGGIYLFRNCGEAGAVRITAPQYNQIINNVFYYSSYEGTNPAVYFGADNGPSTHRFCGADSGYQYGSGADDRDFASENVVMQNQLYERSAADMIRTQWLDTNTPNYVAANPTVTSAVSRPTGCFSLQGYRTSFLAHGASIDLFRDGRGGPYWSPIEQTCVDGELRYAWDERGRLERVPFSCAASGTDAGCSGTVTCPGFGTLVGAHAACNLEVASVSDAELASVPGDVIRVVRASDRPSDGSCWIRGHGVQSGEVSIARRLNTASNGFGCREHDANGGDCRIRGMAYCYYP